MVTGGQLLALAAAFRALFAVTADEQVEEISISFCSIINSGMLSFSE